MEKSGRATEHDLTMTRYNLEFVQYRMREKDSQNEQPTTTGTAATVPEKVQWQAGELFAIPTRHDT
jgi:hypothetical protein